jgi:hypothetical protein
MSLMDKILSRRPGNSTMGQGETPERENHGVSGEITPPLIGSHMLRGETLRGRKQISEMLGIFSGSAY